MLHQAVWALEAQRSTTDCPPKTSRSDEASQGGHEAFDIHVYLPHTVSHDKYNVKQGHITCFCVAYKKLLDTL